MFIGHFALSLGARGTPNHAPTRPSLGTWIMATQWLDLLWPVGLLTGLERVQVTNSPNPFLVLRFEHYPWTHSLLMTLVWAVLFAAVYRWRTGDRRAALWLGAAVASHWVLDFIVHMPDLPLYPGSDVKLGLGLWQSVPATLFVEFALYIAGCALYLRDTKPLDAIGRWGAWALLVFLVAGYAASLAGPPPPSVMALGGSALVGGWLLVAWAWWVDKHRVQVA